mmetsp:Transcript_35665/g.76150  ORF Transcript_35665/g.76150 Transcript_35665/m.76150 type:complete len:355 (-) Transcript_35665:411-1475(-)
MIPNRTLAHWVTPACGVILPHPLRARVTVHDTLGRNPSVPLQYLPNPLVFHFHLNVRHGKMLHRELSKLLRVRLVDVDPKFFPRPPARGLVHVVPVSHVTSTVQLPREAAVLHQPCHDAAPFFHAPIPARGIACDQQYRRVGVMLYNVLQSPVVDSGVVTGRTLQADVGYEVDGHDLAMLRPSFLLPGMSDLVCVAPFHGRPVGQVVLHHAESDAAVLGARVDGGDAAAIEIRLHSERGTLGKVEADDGQGERDRFFGIFVELLPRQGGAVSAFCCDVIGHEFFAGLVSNGCRFWKGPWQWLEVVGVVRGHEPLRLFVLFLLLIVVGLARTFFPIVVFLGFRPLLPFGPGGGGS